MGDVRCGYCGAVAPAGARYCPKCGASSEFLSGKKASVQAGSEPAIQPLVKEVYREKETIREVVKVRCLHCGTLFEDKLNKCPTVAPPYRRERLVCSNNFPSFLLDVDTGAHTPPHVLHCYP